MDPQSVFPRNLTKKPKVSSKEGCYIFMLYFCLSQDNMPFDDNQAYENVSYEKSVIKNQRNSGPSRTFQEIYKKEGWIVVEFIMPLAVLSILNILLILKVN